MDTNDHNASSAALRAQFAAVRREIDLRTAIQSALVAITAMGVLLAVLVMSRDPKRGIEITLAFAAMDLFLALHWMHNDVRHLQLGRYLAREIEPKLALGARGWEEVHATLPRETPLGSYSLIGRRAIFVAAPLVLLAIARQDWSCAQRRGEALLICSVAVAIIFLTRLPSAPEDERGRGAA